MDCSKSGTDFRNFECLDDDPGDFLVYEGAEEGISSDGDPWNPEEYGVSYFSCGVFR